MSMSMNIQLDMILFRFVDDSKIRLFWDPPVDEGSRTDTRYTVSCPGCPSRPTLPAANAMTAQTSVQVSNLQVRRNNAA